MYGLHFSYRVRVRVFADGVQLVELTRRVNTEIVDSGLLKDRKKSLKTFKSAFEFSDFVGWLTAHSNCGSKQMAEEIAGRMLAAGFIEVRPFL